MLSLTVLLSRLEQALTSSTTKTTTMTTSAAKLYGKDIGEYDDLDVDQLLSQLSPEEISILAKEVDPDLSSLESDFFSSLNV
ncbi:Tropomodulin-1 [Homalodisca vitripennis]|nr:Tropomodulin-1 [Homalodisca vitripennis]